MEASKAPETSMNGPVLSVFGAPDHPLALQVASRSLSPAARIQRRVFFTEIGGARSHQQMALLLFRFHSRGG